MAVSHNRDLPLAKMLARHFAAEREEGFKEGVEALRKVLKPRSYAARKAFMKRFRTYLRRELKLSELIIEHAGPLSEEAVSAIRASLEATTQRRLVPQTRENPKLLGGVRIALGDDVYDASVAGRLSALQNAVK